MNSHHTNSYLIDLLDDLYDLILDHLRLLGITRALHYAAHYVSDTALLGELRTVIVGKLLTCSSRV